MPLIALVSIGLVLIIGGVLFVILSVRWFTSDELSPRLRTFVVEQNIQPQSRSPAMIARTREFSGSLGGRIILPLLRRMGVFIGQMIPPRSTEEVRRQLSVAGNPMGLGAREYYGLRVVFILLGLGLAFVILRRGTTQLQYIISLLSIAFGFLLPMTWLRMSVQKSQKSISKSLPDALDMLSVCATAGLGFDQALQRVSEEWKTPMALEFGRVVSEMEMGVSRQDAMRNMANRLQVDELSSFVSIILQSAQLGMSISDTLIAQADQMRVERRFRAKEQANKIPIKMMIPLAFMIFPAMLAVLLGPAIPQLLSVFDNF